MNLIQKLNSDRVSVLLNSLEKFEKKTENSKIIKLEEFELLKSKIIKKSTLTDRLVIYKIILSIVIYFSFLSSIILKIDTYGIITDLVNTILEIVGITLLVVLLFIVNYFINLKLYELTLLYTEILNLK
jgi:hypothetical protein